MAHSGSSGSSWTMRLGLGAAAVFTIGPLLAHFSIVPPRVGFVIFDLGGLLGVIAAVVGIISALRGRTGWGAMAPGAVIAAAFLGLAVNAAKYPPINDISTDLDEPPVFTSAKNAPGNAGRDLRYPGSSFADQQRAAYPKIANLALPVSPDEAYRRVLSTARAMPNWEIISTDDSGKWLDGAATSWLFRFQDDFVIEVRLHDNGSQVVMRSKSRDGKSDLGANAKRIEEFFAKLRP
jgi:uncharacterized protein (DUF1499 family)